MNIHLLSSNILLDSHFVAKLGDFGFARTKPKMEGGQSFWTGEMCGTKGYMAPEVALGEVSPKVDLQFWHCKKNLLYSLWTC